jgi:hypothetical protein
MMAKTVEIVFIDFFSVRTKITYRLLGAWPTLFILQARGWPFILFFWGIFDFALLYGTHPFYAHWLYMQGTIALFNGSNPSGHVVDSEWNHKILSIAVSLAAVVAVKRFSMGLYLGRQIFQQYSDKLAAVMRKIILISQVSALAKDFERHARVYKQRGLPILLSKDRLENLFGNDEEDSTALEALGTVSHADLETAEGTGTTPVIDPEDRHPLTGSLSYSQRLRITQLLGAWEEPQVSEQNTVCRWLADFRVDVFRLFSASFVSLPLSCCVSGECLRQWSVAVQKSAGLSSNRLSLFR